MCIYIYHICVYERVNWQIPMIADLRLFHDKNNFKNQMFACENSRYTYGWCIQEER